MDRDSQESIDLRVMMKSPEAKRWMGAFFDHCNLYRSVYSEDSQLFAYRAGMQQAARILEAALYRADPTLPGQCRALYESGRELKNQLKEEQEDE
jgi:hypothetical protein